MNILDIPMERPFGNGGWKFEVYVAMIKGGAIPGKLDADGYVDQIDKRAVDELILEQIELLR